MAILTQQEGRGNSALLNPWYTQVQLRFPFVSHAHHMPKSDQTVVEMRCPFSFGGAGSFH